MKSRLLLLALCTAGLAQAQSTAITESAHGILDTNQIKTRVNALGDMWWNPITMASQCEFPAGSGKHIATAGALWMSAYDPAGDLHVAAQTYRQGGMDYWTGPSHLSWSEEEGNKWGRVWKVTKKEIHAFLSQSEHTLANTPASILEWPGKSNPYAKGAAGVALTVIGERAPFVDVDGDGDYNPLLGDYPKIKGDQMLWNIFTDAVSTHSASGGIPLVVNVQQSSYAYDAPGALGRMIFYEYEVSNQSNGSYDSFRLAFLADLDLGFGLDDYVGFDSARRMGIVFNSLPTDTDYGTILPSAAVVLLESPGDVPGIRRPASFTMYDNSESENGNPTNAEEYNYYIRGRNRLGAWQMYDSVYQIDWSVPGGSAYECESVAPPNDKRFLLSTPDTTFAAGAHHKYAYALIVADDAGGCPDVDFTGIAETADSAYIFYWDPATTGIPTTVAPKLMLYPNPATQEVYCTVPDGVRGVSAINALGQSVALPYRQENGKLVVRVQQLPAGVYTLCVQGRSRQEHAVFVKQ